MGLLAQEKKILRNKQISGTTITEAQLNFLKGAEETLKRFERPKVLGMIEVPVKVHIVRSSQGNNVSIESVKTAFEQLNKHFIPISIQFVPLGDFNYIQNEKFYNLEKENENSLVAGNDEKQVINLYVVGSIQNGPVQFCGYTHYPEDVEKNTDRVFIDGDCLTDGVSLSRQMGHYFTLYPTKGLDQSESREWVNGENCELEGDQICDTPADPGLTLDAVDDRCGYIGRKQDLSGRKRFYKPDTRNLMSDNPRLYCCDHFSEQQYRKILFAALTIRNYLTFPKQRYSKKQLRVLSEEKGIQGEVQVYIQGAEMPLERNKNMYVCSHAGYPSQAPFIINITNHKKGYVYVIEGDSERGIYLQYPKKGDKFYFRGEEPITFTAPSNEKRIKVDALKGKDGKNHIMVLFSKKQLRIEELVDEMNESDLYINAIQRMYMVLGTNIIPSNNIEYNKTAVGASGIATDQQIMPIIIEYLQE